MSKNKVISGNRRRPGEVLAFMRALWAMDHALRSASKRMRIHLGVTGPQRLVIRMVGRYPGVDAGELADLLRIHPSTLTGILARLEDGKYLTRVIDREDARRSLFFLTARGETMDRAESGTVEARLRWALASIPVEHTRITQEVLETLATALDESGV